MDTPAARLPLVVLSIALAANPIVARAEGPAPAPAAGAPAAVPDPAAPGHLDELSTEDPDDALDEAAAAAALEAKLTFRRGTIVLGDNLASLSVPDDWRYLGPEDSRAVLQDAWGNPPGPLTLGMLFPSATSPFAQEGWGVVITYDEDGHVDDADAQKLDYAELMADMKKGAEEESRDRVKAGFDSLEILGWAEPPRYDASAKKLYWAKEISFGGSPEHTLNYAVRILGRKGVLVMNAVSGMGQLPAVRPAMQTVIGFTDFNAGSRYADFNPGLDKVAAYGIGGLVAGKIAVKAGLFKVLIGVLLASKKGLVALLAVVGAAASRLLGRRKKEEEPLDGTGASG